MRLTTTARAMSVAVVVALALAGCAGTPPSGPAPTTPLPSAPATPEPAGEVVTFTSVVDGDTIRTSAGTVRIIGIDSPERGECGYSEAAASIWRLVSRGDQVTLELPPGQNDRDRHDRLLRYVTTGAGIDIGMAQLESGNAIAKYDSRDGYPAHPREAAYHAAQVATVAPDGTVLTLACQGSAAPPRSHPRWTTAGGSSTPPAAGSSATRSAIPRAPSTATNPQRPRSTSGSPSPRETTAMVTATVSPASSGCRGAAADSSRELVTKR